MVINIIFSIHLMKKTSEEVKVIWAMVIFIREKFVYNVDTVCDKHGYILGMSIDSRNNHDNTLKNYGLFL